MLVGNAVGWLLIVLARALLSTLQDGHFPADLLGPRVAAVIWPSLVLVPFAVGLVAAWFWRGLELKHGAVLVHSLATSVLGLVASWTVMGEGIVCILMVSPLLYTAVAAGALTGRVWFRTGENRLKLSILPLVALAVLVEPKLRVDQNAVVTDEVLIFAPPARVWPHVLAFPEIPDRPHHLLFWLGLPYPTRTTNSGEFVGAARACIFSSGVTLHERVSEFVPHERLTFQITEQPTHPEAYGHLTLHRGQFILRDNGNGTTTLFGSSWYALHVRPRWYFNLWMESATRAVHQRVMEHIARLAEG